MFDVSVLFVARHHPRLCLLGCLVVYCLLIFLYEARSERNGSILALRYFVEIRLLAVDDTD